MVAAGSVFFDAFGSSFAEGRQGSGNQPGTVPLLQRQRNDEWCEELWFIFSYSLTFLQNTAVISIQLLTVIDTVNTQTF